LKSDAKIQIMLAACFAFAWKRVGGGFIKIVDMQVQLLMYTLNQ